MVTYGEDFENNPYFTDMCNEFDVSEMDRVHFFKFSLFLAARQHYKRVVNYLSSFADVCHTFRYIYAVDTTKKQISTRLRNLSIDYFRGVYDEVEQTSLDALLRRINAILHMSNNRYRDDVSLI